MGKKREPAGGSGSAANDLFARSRGRRRAGLFLRRFLADEADKVHYRTKSREEAHGILRHWADLEEKSAERKRFGTYYTPPEFTRLIVHETVGDVIREWFQALLAVHGLTREQTLAEKPSAKAAAYWRACLAALGDMKVCDPACGSGAFLIAAYDALEVAYTEVVDRLVLHDGPHADDLADDISDTILAENLYGVDVSQQAVEITQLALWLRSAQRGKRLADLSKNVVWKNSLVTDPAVHDKAMHWETQFPEVFSRPDNPGFDCVIGNPPWERMKLQEREFFAFSAPPIARRSQSGRPPQARRAAQDGQAGTLHGLPPGRGPRRAARWPTSAQRAISPSRPRATSIRTWSLRSWPSGSWPPMAAPGCWCPRASPPTTPPASSSAT